MTVPEFISKVNLPSFCYQLGVATGLTFKKIPKFGWLAVHHDKERALTIFDFFPRKTAVEDAYRYVTIDHPNLLEAKMWFSETSLTKLRNHYNKWTAIEELHRSAIQEVRNNVVFRPEGGTDRVRFQKWAETNGYTEFFNRAQVGVITERVLALADQTGASDELDLGPELKNSLIVPSFCAPGRPSTVEVLQPTSYHTTEIFRMVERGWYGKLGIRIHQKLADLTTSPGCTWDPKVPYWTNESVTLGDTLLPASCIEIWSSPEPLLCTPSPLEIIKSANQLDKLVNLTGNLTLSQVEELEKQTGEQLQKLWRANRSTAVEVCGTEFLTVGDRYYISRHRQAIEYTNFTMKLTKIVRGVRGYTQHGFIYHNGVELPFEMDRHYFDSFNLLLKGLTKVFLESGLGVPMVAPNFKHYLTNVIHAFNPDIAIESAQPVVETTESGRNQLPMTGSSPNVSPAEVT